MTSRSSATGRWCRRSAVPPLHVVARSADPARPDARLARSARRALFCQSPLGPHVCVLLPAVAICPGPHTPAHARHARLVRTHRRPRLVDASLRIRGTRRRADVLVHTLPAALQTGWLLHVHADDPAMPVQLWCAPHARRTVRPTAIAPEGALREAARHARGLARRAATSGSASTQRSEPSPARLGTGARQCRRDVRATVRVDRAGCARLPVLARHARLRADRRRADEPSFRIPSSRVAGADVCYPGVNRSARDVALPCLLGADRSVLGSIRARTVGAHTHRPIRTRRCVRGEIRLASKAEHRLASSERQEPERDDRRGKPSH